jgi:hypothetical protein
MKSEAFHIKPTQQETKQNIDSYCLINNQDFIDDKGNPRITNDQDNRVMARAIPNKPSKHMTNTQMQYRFYIKMDNNITIHNPIVLASSVKDKKPFDFINNTCKSGSIFKEVSQSIFDKYITFLKTKNTRWLNAAQRELK